MSALWVTLFACYFVNCLVVEVVSSRVTKWRGLQNIRQWISSPVRKVAKKLWYVWMKRFKTIHKEQLLPLKNTIWAVDYLSRRDRSELDFGLSWGLCVSRCLLYRVYNITGRKRLWFFIPLQWSMKWSF